MQCNSRGALVSFTLLILLLLILCEYLRKEGREARVALTRSLLNNYHAKGALGLIVFPSASIHYANTIVICQSVHLGLLLLFVSLFPFIKLTLIKF